MSPHWCRLMLTRDGRLWLVPRWCRLLMLQALLVSLITGYVYGATHFRSAEPTSESTAVAPYVWLDLAADAAAVARDARLLDLQR